MNAIRPKSFTAAIAFPFRCMSYNSDMSSSIKTSESKYNILLTSGNRSVKLSLTYVVGDTYDADAECDGTQYFYGALLESISILCILNELDENLSSTLETSFGTLSRIT